MFCSMVGQDTLFVNCLEVDAIHAFHVCMSPFGTGRKRVQYFSDEPKTTHVIACSFTVLILTLESLDRTIVLVDAQDLLFFSSDG